MAAFRESLSTDKWPGWGRLQNGSLLGAVEKAGRSADDPERDTCEPLPYRYLIIPDSSVAWCQTSTPAVESDDPQHDKSCFAAVSRAAAPNSNDTAIASLT